ncbi:MAG: photosynthetic reaction center cytochrome c subunit family protein [Vicinamibacterales bacterium]
MFKSDRGRRRLGAGATAVVWLLSLTWMHAQGGAAPKPLLAEQAFKNVQILRGIPVDEFMNTMGFISASLGMNCQDCHTKESGGDWAKYADETPIKQTSRRMLVMVDAINRANFGGQQLVTCNTCHQGAAGRPKVRPSMALLYGELPPAEPGDAFEQAPGQPQASTILNRHIEAVGGASKAASLTSLTAKGTYQSFSVPAKAPAELYVRVSGARSIIMRLGAAEMATTFDGQNGWMTAPSIARPLPVIDITGQELEALKLETDVLFPTRIPQALKDWRVGFPLTIDDRDVQLVQGTTAGGATVTLCFDAETGLLARAVRVTKSPIGPIVSQTDYADYRDVAGVKIPFRTVISWMSGQTVFEWTDIQANVAIPDARFARPSAR